MHYILLKHFRKINKEIFYLNYWLFVWLLSTFKGLISRTGRILHHVSEMPQSDDDA